MLGLGSLFLSVSVAYAPLVYSLLFGEVLGIGSGELVPTAGLAAASVIGLAILYRPLMLSSVSVRSRAGARASVTSRSSSDFWSWSP